MFPGLFVGSWKPGPARWTFLPPFSSPLLPLDTISASFSPSRALSLCPASRPVQHILCLALVVLAGLSAFSPRPVTAQTPVIYHSDGDGNSDSILRLEGGTSSVFAEPPTRAIGPIAVDEEAGKVYWASDVTRTIERANLDGSNIEVLLTDPDVDIFGFEALHLDLQSTPKKMYFIVEGFLKRANLDGSNPEIVTSISLSAEGMDLARVNGTTRVYYPDFRTLYVIDGDGSNQTALYSISTGNISNVSVDATVSPVEIFFHEPVPNEIYRLVEGASSPTRVVASEDVGNRLTALTLDQSASPKRFYWTDRGADEVKSANLDGTQIRFFSQDIERFEGGTNKDIKTAEWTSHPLFTSSLGILRRFDRDGSNPQTILDSRFETADLTLDFTPSGAGLIWGNERRGAIQRQDLGSSTSSSIVSLDDAVFDLVVTADRSSSPAKIYWSNTPDGVSSTLSRANVDGSEREIINDRLFQVNNLVVDATASPKDIYWSSGGGIGRADLDGSNREVVDPISSEGFAVDLSQTPREIYTYDRSGESIVRIFADGSGQETVVADAPRVRDLALDLSAPTPKLYWSSEFDPSTSTIQRANLDGSNIDVVADDPAVEYGQIDLRTTPEIAVLSDTRTLLDDESTYTFDATLPVGDRTSRTLRALNLGSEVLEITNVSASGDFEVTSVSANTVTENAAADLAITFQPTAAGTRTGTLTLATNDVTGDEGTYEITLTATAEAGLALTDGSAAGLDFTPSVTPGTDRNAVGTFRVEGTASGGSLTALTVTSDAPGISGIPTARLFASDDNVLDDGDAELSSVSVDPQDAPATFTFGGFNAALPSEGTTVFVAFDVASDAPAESVGLRLASPDDLTVTDASLTSVNGASASTFADLPLSSVSATLPVEWGGVTARGDASGRLSVQWQTLSEVNSSGFSVQYRDARDGASSAPGTADWIDGPRLDSRGTPTEGTSYRVDVTNVAPGPYDVRIRQTDVDGTSSLSPVATATVPLGEPLQLTATPNPVRQQATITWTVANPGPVRVEMFDVLGRRVRTLYDGPMEAHTPKRHTLRRGSLASGLYFVRLTSETGTATQKVTLVR